MQRLRSQFRIQQHLCQDSFEIPRGQHRGGDIEMGQRSGELGLDNFFKQVQEIDKQYDKLNKLLKKLQDAHEDSRAVTKADARKGLRLLLHFLLNSIKQRMEKDVDEVGKIARFIKLKIEELDRDVRPYTGSSLRLYTTLYAGLQFL
ncbi:hypothetical protein RJ639_024350 [Escallonia herrerae]|uniref:Syntaxin N-terminal domain-containing protein n=1 Tax=Escallonia herrerae TaxID=1293975 RepID=A0AA88UYM7_9ASTE|nr:hypothetical protein RJ639_024350 [Escallonia herrerae]